MMSCSPSFLAPAPAPAPVIKDSIGESGEYMGKVGLEILWLWLWGGATSSRSTISEASNCLWGEILSDKVSWSHNTETNSVCYLPESGRTSDLCLP